MDELLDTLPAIEDMEWNGGDFFFPKLVKKRPHAFISEDGDLCISGEYGDDLIDYYGDYRASTLFIHPELVEWATKNGGYWEWVHTGAICFVR